MNTPPPPPGSTPPPRQDPYSPPRTVSGNTGQGGDEQTRAPAIGMMVAGGLSLLATLFALAKGISVEEIFKLYEDMGIDTSEMLQWSDLMQKSATASSLIGVVFAVFVIYAGFKMSKRDSWGVCMAGSIIALIPCSSCCCLNIPIGIWALVVLLKDDVKNGFT